MPDLITLGEALIDLPAAQSGVSLTEARTFAKVPAGATANVAAAAVRLGLSAAFLSRVGEDSFGEAIMETFAAQGVDVSHVVKDASARTGLAFVSVLPDGDRDFLFYYDPARDLPLRAEELDLAWLGTARALHYGSISLIAEPARSATLAAAGIVRGTTGAICSYDPNLRPWLWPNDNAMRQGALLGFQMADLAKISAEELLFLYPKAASETGAIRRLWADFPNLRLAVITEGAQGSRGYTPSGEAVYKPGYSVDFVDGTGAGDAFTAGLLKFLFEVGQDLKEALCMMDGPHLHGALMFANACGALATTTLGASATALTEAAATQMIKT